MTTIKNVLSTAGAIALICGFVIVTGAPGHLDAFDGTMLDFFRQVAIGIGVGVLGMFMRTIAR